MWHNRILLDLSEADGNNQHDLYLIHSLGIGVPLPAQVEKRVKDVMDDMQISDKRRLIKPFTVFGFDIIHAGCTQTTTGAIIGIPSNFGYKSTSDVDRAHVLVSSIHKLHLLNSVIQ